jgi:ribokinase
VQRILVIGSANADLVTRVPRCPKPGESLVGHSFQTLPGGKGANQAVAAARLGAKTRFAGCVGNDALGEMLKASLRSSGVDILHLKTHATDPTGTAVIFVEDSGQNAIVVTPSANYGILPQDIKALEPVFRDSDVVLIQLEIPLETVEAALNMACNTGVFSVLDAGPAQMVAPEILKLADIVSPNESEAEAITGITIKTRDDAIAAADKLRAMGARSVVLKLGAQGCMYAGSERVFAGAFEVEALDTTAAGDAFTAALALQWNTVSTFDALRFANATGALATMVMGAQPSMPSLKDVERFLKEASAK